MVAVRHALSIRSLYWPIAVLADRCQSDRCIGRSLSIRSLYWPMDVLADRRIGQYVHRTIRRLASSGSLPRNKERKDSLEQVVFDLSIQSSSVLARILIGRHGVGVERDDVSSSRIGANVEVRNEAVLAAAVPYETLAEIVFDEKRQSHGVFSILPFRLNNRTGIDGDLPLEHLFER